jgi:hypothetical protein
MGKSIGSNFVTYSEPADLPVGAQINSKYKTRNDF